MTQVKSSESEQLCRVSDTAVIDDNATNAIAPLADSSGRLWVRVVDSITPIGSGRIQQNTGGILVESLVISPQACSIIGIVGWNDSPSSAVKYIQLFDNTILPVLGDVPDVIIPVPGGDTSFSYDLPYNFIVGLSIGISTTKLTFTGAGPILSFTAVVNIAV